MKLRNQVLTLSLATVLVPWFGWKLVQELEGFLRVGQEEALLAAGRTMAQALPTEFRGELQYGRDHVLPLRDFERAPILDGYADEWFEPGSGLVFGDEHARLGLQVLAGRHAGQLYLFCRVDDDTPVRQRPPGPGGTAGSDGIDVFLRNARGLTQFNVRTAAPGPLLVDSRSAGGGQLEGWWNDRAGGYDIEMALPPGGRSVDVSIGVVDVRPGPSGTLDTVSAGTVRDGRPETWLIPAPPLGPLRAWLESVIPDNTRAWVLDAEGWVVADTGPLPVDPAPELTWAERTLYASVAGEHTDLRSERPERIMRMDEDLFERAIGGETARRWSRDPETAEVWHTAVVPVDSEGVAVGAVMLESRSDGLLLVTNRALGRLLLVTVLLTVVLAAGLWFFATRLSRRVQRLSTAVSRAMDDAAEPGELPLTGDHDELGVLARNNARLLRAVAEYTRYLQQLAGRLSHELKTPLAITRSSLDNLAASDLDDEARRYVQRALEGLDRQGNIVRAMSEANRLEASVASADWEVVDLVTWLEGAAEAYGAAHPGLAIDLETPAEAVPCRCAPDLLTQALDKLVDNAVSLMGPGDRLSLVLEPKGNWRHVRVRNTGTRLPEDFQDQLFDSLVSVRDPGERGKHLGLGLHIVRLVARAHGGDVSAGNLPGGAGVEFTVSLPAG